MNYKKILLSLFTALLSTMFIGFDISYADNSQKQNKKPGIYSVGKMHMDIPYHNKAILMNNGKVFHTHGIYSEVFDPKTNKFTLVAKNKAFGSSLLNLDNETIMGIQCDECYSLKKIHEIVFNIYNNKSNTIKELFKIKTHLRIHTDCALKLKNNKIFIPCVNSNYILDIKNQKFSEDIRVSDSNFIKDEHSQATKAEIIETENGDIYVFGLPFYKKNDSTKKKNYVFKYNQTDNVFVYTGELKEQRLGGGGKIKVFKYDDENILVIGGVDSSSHDSVRSIEKYNIKTNTSEIIGELPVPYSEGRILLLDNNKLIYNIPSSVYVQSDIYKPLVYNLKTQKKEYTEGGLYDYIWTSDSTMTKLQDGSILFSGGGHSNRESKKSYRYYYSQN